MILTLPVSIYVFIYFIFFILGFHGGLFMISMKLCWFYVCLFSFGYLFAAYSGFYALGLFFESLVTFFTSL